MAAGHNKRPCYSAVWPRKALSHLVTGRVSNHNQNIEVNRNWPSPYVWWAPLCLTIDLSFAHFKIPHSAFTTSFEESFISHNKASKIFQWSPVWLLKIFLLLSCRHHHISFVSSPAFFRALTILHIVLLAIPPKINFFIIRSEALNDYNCLEYMSISCLKEVFILM